MEKPIIQIMPAENGAIVQVQFGGEVKSYVAHDNAEAVAITATALQTEVVIPAASKSDTSKTATEAAAVEPEKPKSKGKNKAAKKAEEKPAPEKSEEPDGTAYTADDLRRILGAAAKKLGGAVVLAKFKEFKFKDVAEVEAAGEEKMAEVCIAFEEAMNA